MDWMESLKLGRADFPTMSPQLDSRRKPLSDEELEERKARLASYALLNRPSPPY
jgi:hypothetical protein